MPQNTQRRSKSKPKSDLENFGHLQPQALELEQAVVGALLIESDAYAQVSDILKLKVSMMCVTNTFLRQSHI